MSVTWTAREKLVESIEEDLLGYGQDAWGDDSYGSPLGTVWTKRDKVADE